LRLVVRDKSGNTSATRLAAGEAKSRREARRFCCSKDRRFPQGLPEEIEEAAQSQTLIEK
jgi:hypothetical protein